jgi:hypothetical protein
MRLPQRPLEAVIRSVVSRCAVAIFRAPRLIVPYGRLQHQQAAPTETRRAEIHPAEIRTSDRDANSWCHGEVTSVPTRASTTASRATTDTTGLVFVAEMHGLQLDQLAELLGLTSRQTRALVTRWSNAGVAESGVLSSGPPWIWLTRHGLGACGFRYPPAPPALSRLAHIRAVTAVRLALEKTPEYRTGDAHWRSERHLRARGRPGRTEHIPDAEVHWPDTGLPWGGECWAIEAELTPKTVSRTTAIMRELLARTGDYGCPAAEAHVPGLPPRHSRAVYLCSAAAAGVVLRARDALGTDRIEVRPLPASAFLA